jgi:hypothetical protein
MNVPALTDEYDHLDQADPDGPDADARAPRHLTRDAGRRQPGAADPTLHTRTGSTDRRSGQ